MRMVAKNMLDLRQPSRSWRWNRRVLRVAAVAAIVATGLLLGWVVWQRFSNRSEDGGSRVVEAKVARHYVLPTGEDPTLATVTDKSKLQTAFLKQANDGDKILIYEKAGVAIIYRPSIDRIIAVGPVSVAPLDTTSGAAP